MNIAASINLAKELQDKSDSLYEQQTILLKQMMTSLKIVDKSLLEREFNKCVHDACYRVYETKQILLRNNVLSSKASKGLDLGCNAAEAPTPPDISSSEHEQMVLVLCNLLIKERNVELAFFLVEQLPHHLIWGEAVAKIRKTTLTSSSSDAGADAVVVQRPPKKSRQQTGLPCNAEFLKVLKKDPGYKKLIGNYFDGDSLLAYVDRVEEPECESGTAELRTAFDKLKTVVESQIAINNRNDKGPGFLKQLLAKAWLSVSPLTQDKAAPSAVTMKLAIAIEEMGKIKPEPSKKQGS